MCNGFCQFVTKNKNFKRNQINFYIKNIYKFFLKEKNLGSQVKALSLCVMAKVRARVE
jgi:hypothetical protein